MNKPLLGCVLIIIPLWLSLALSAAAQGSPALPQSGLAPTQSAVPIAPAISPNLLTNYVESGVSYLTLTNGYGCWASGYTRIVFQHGNDVWTGEANGQREFKDLGTYFALGDTHTFSANWYGSLTVGSSAGGFFWPRMRGDAFLNKKWLGRKQWITTFGYGYFEAKDVHRNHSPFFGSTYYFSRPWILEEGIYFNISNPGRVFAPSGFVAVTQGRDKHGFITVRAGMGEEGYQLVGPAITLTQFRSQSATITWRKWISRTWGLNMVGDFYRNPFYTRGGSSFGFFKDF
jgi:YaiO family outer membrane protein